MGVGPIPWTAVDRYAKRYGYSGEDFESLLAMIEAMDEAFLAHLKKTSGKEGENGS